VAELQKDHSRVRLGVRGEYRRIAFHIVGRVQMKYDGGFWNEWCLSFQDGRYGWLGEAMGQYSVSFQTKTPVNLPSEDQIELGQEINIAGKIYTLTSWEEASYYSAEGELPTELPLGETSVFADLSNSDGGFATLDFSESPPLVFLGEYVTVQDLKLQGLQATEVQ
jgi:hypothetical protein